jgi:uncharacterized repeat protein (TIGR01451 family)
VWERFGVDTNNDGIIDVTLPGADPLRTDLFVQVDHLEATTHTHAPAKEAIQRVVGAFAAAPTVNADGTTGVQLHVDVGPLFGANVIVPITGPTGATGSYGDLGGGKAIAEAGNEVIDAFGRGVGSGTSFADLKAAHFDSARQWLFRYAIFGHQTNARASTQDCSTGVTLLHSPDFLVTLGGNGVDLLPCWGTDANFQSVGDSFQQSGTFMHELGHSLGLNHGGDDAINTKPNYLSVMNYDFQFCTTPFKQGLLAGSCDYARLVAGAPLPTLDERSLDECVGLGTVLGFGPFDWNGNGQIEGANCSAVTPNVVADINHDGVCVTPGADRFMDTTAAGDDKLDVLGIVDGPNRVCDTKAAAGRDDVQVSPVNTTPIQPDLLHAFDDWGHIEVALLDRLIIGDATSGVAPLEADRTDIENARRHLRESTSPALHVEQVGPASVKPGDQVTVTINVTNVGHGPALQTTLQTQAPDGTTASMDIDTIPLADTVSRLTSFTVPATACPGDASGASATLTFTNMAADVLTLSSPTPLNILDIAAPSLQLSVSPDRLWPPNHKLHRVIATIATSDNCDRHPTVTLVSITSNEPDEHHGRDHSARGGLDEFEDNDGPDIQGAAFGTDDRVFYLRAEREGRNRQGRVYTVTYRVTDASGNATLKTATVTVPHSQGGQD